MGHWADSVLPELKERLRIRGTDDDALLLECARKAQAHIELVTGRSLGAVEPLTKRFNSGGLPFVPVPDLRGQPLETSGPCWSVPDPITQEVATVLQVAVPATVSDRAMPTAEVLTAAGRMVGLCVAEKRFTESVLEWLSAQSHAGEFGQLIPDLLDPNVSVQVPVAAGEGGGWWIQLSRRLLIVTMETPDHHRLLEPIVRLSAGAILAASEPTLIVARLTEHPVTWAMTIRVWWVDEPADAAPWRTNGLAGTVHRHGLPIISIDAQTTAAEATAQLLLAAHWHGYLCGQESSIPPALMDAFPREVALVRRGTTAPDSMAAATLLFERLHRPGFDPGRGAESIRHYVRRHASTIVKAHRMAEMHEHPWERLGVTERNYYRLLVKVAAKSGDGRYAVDEALLERLRERLDRRDQARDRRRAAMALLRLRGFSEAAARKWLQRHPLDAIRTAHPRRARR